MKRGAWIQTHSGRRFYPLDPRPEEVRLGDIAHALSRICRFSGHCTRFYSVAEHSLHVALHVAWEEAPPARPVVLAALLHDASEAYLCDLPRPIKHMPEMAPYRTMEARVEAVIAERFGLPRETLAVVARHDGRALATERRDLVQDRREDWGLRESPWPDMPPGCLATTKSAFSHMGIDHAFPAEAASHEAWIAWTEAMFTALFAHLTGVDVGGYGPEHSDAAAWLLRAV